MAAYFFSDVHLGLQSREVEKQKENRLLGFLKSILPTCDHLFIVGDLFDFWFEYKTVIPKGFHRTLAALQEFTDCGAKVHYLAGNHDFWMGDFFRTELGMELHFDPFETTVAGKRIFFHHGDGLAKNDTGYKLIKPVLRNKFNIRLYRWLHPDIGVRLARGSSRSSREYTSNKHYGEEEGMIECAREQISRGVDIVMMGHRHKPRCVPIGQGMYMNLGDWIEYNTYAELSNGSVQLKAWNGTTGQPYGER
ncbi:MAG: UDP-2,3-diacylglucosamine diphosphatase [Bacteroidetes bacterium]|nr:UDP-2,3-diacylglucosamine diphosphatase [Bacteroidota bacterium]